MFARIGLLFAGRPFDEEKILTCAYAYEQATKQILSNSEALMTKL
jgi:Asp-tRNA(Asn)/Glu-tRNA(Gln) amidotransferase A subunit family amidase